VVLAKHLIAWLHSPADAEHAEAEFNKIFRDHGVPDEMPEVAIAPGPHKLAPLLVQAGLASSNSEANRKIREKAVSLDGQKVEDPAREYSFTAPVVVKLGRKFARLRPA
jgi:tyrosyl-tRNA synthetase